MGPLAGVRIVEFAGMWKKRGRVFAAPAYYAFSMYSGADIDHALTVKTDGKSYDVEHGIDRFPKIRDVPYLDCAATMNKSGDKVTAFCVNRSTVQDYPVEFRFSGFQAGAARGQALFADSIYEVNDEDNPEQIVPRTQSVRMEGDVAKAVLRHESVTVVEFTRR